MNTCGSLAPHDPVCACVVDAIAKHDSVYATKGSGVRFHNIGNIRCLGSDNISKTDCITTPTNASFASFDTVHDSIVSLVDLYVRKYAGLSADTLAHNYSMTGQGSAYMKAIEDCYH